MALSSNSLSILSCTNTNQLSEFVSHMVPKIWTGTPFTTSQRLNAFRTFCQNMIHTTQISSSCVLVALFYIYRLRFAYPSIRGSMGSEVRLFTTALVLANKFLDDNTFTNKTWSEVSSVPLHELNIMEMEFLSALQYKTCIHYVQFFSWSTQCQLWMSQLVINSTINSSKNHLLMHTKKRHLNYHPYQRPMNRYIVHNSMESNCTTSNHLNHYYYNQYNAASVATVAAQTAMNVTNFIPRV